MSEQRFTPIPEPKCLSCGEPFTTMKVVKLHDDGFGVLHDCGTVYTREFMRDHFGIEWEHDPARVTYGVEP